MACCQAVSHTPRGKIVFSLLFVSLQPADLRDTELNTEYGILFIVPMSSPDKFPPTFWSYLEAHPDEEVAAIVRVQALSPEVESAAVAAGCHIRRRLTLLPSLAVRATGRALMALADHPLVVRIEPDQDVRAL